MEWISVEDRLPKDCSVVLCISGEMKLDQKYVVRTFLENDWFNEYGQSTMNVNGEKEHIKQWAKIEPPKETE